MTRQYGQFEKDDFYVKFTLDIIANKYTDGRMDGWTDGNTNRAAVSTVTVNNG